MVFPILVDALPIPRLLKAKALADVRLPNLQEGHKSNVVLQVVLSCFGKRTDLDNNRQKQVVATF